MKTTRQLRWLLISGLIGANLAFFVVTGYSILQTKQQFEHRAENLSQNVALAASQSIIASVEKIDLMLNGIKWEIESRFNSEHRTINPDLLGMLKHLQKSLPEVRAIRVANAEGIVVVGSGPQGNQHFSVVDRKYFAHHLSHDDNELYISKPLAGRLSDTPIVVFGRRLNFPNGDFAGVVYAIVDVKYLDQLLASFDLGEHGTITVRDSKLALITRWPPISDSPAGQTGSRQVSPELLAILNQGVDSGTIFNSHSVDGERRTVSFRRLSGFPLLIVAGVAPQDYLADLWGKRLILDLAIALGFALLSVFVAGFSLKLIRQADTSRIERTEELNRLLKIASRVPGVVYQFRMTADGSVSFPFASSSIYDLFGVMPEDLKFDATPALAMIVPEDIDGFNRTVRESAHNLTPWAHEFRTTRPDGSIRWLRGNSIPQAEPDGSTLWHGFISDVTDRKAEEKAIESKAKNLVALLETASDGIHIVDEVGSLIQFSRSFATMLGYSMEEIRNFNVVDWDVDIPRENVPARIKAVIESPQTFNTRHRRKDGSIIDVEIHAKGFEIDEKKYLYASSRDITERMRSAKKIRELLEEQSSMLNSNIVGIVRLADRKIAWCNERFASFFGYTQDELIGKLTRIIYATDEEFKAFGRAAYPAMKNGEVVREQLRLCHKDGTCGWFEVGGGRLRPDSAETMWALVDVTARKLLEDKIKSMAFFDALTDLPNRRLLGDRLKQALATNRRSGKYGALMFIDLDNFKPLNDSAGHDAGDLLLIEVGQRLTRCMRATDTVARVGGDEFVAMACELAGDLTAAEAQAKLIAEKVRQVIAVPYVLSIQHAGQSTAIIEHRCTASIGVTIFPQAIGEPEDYLKWADLAMYHAKETGRNQVLFYSPWDTRRTAGA